MDTKSKLKYLESKQKKFSFSGAYYASNECETLMGSSGFANRSEKIINQVNTRFAMASGCKLFTSVAICLLVERGEISFGSKLVDCVDIDFPNFDQEITVHHLLTHTSGVPDYFNEEVMDDFEMLWESHPMYHIRSPKDFLPMFQYERMQAERNGGFEYNNSGYILLGLIVEQVTKCSFADFVEEQIFQKAGMKDSGYFDTDRLPERTALGYIDGSDGNWKTNIFSLPAKGGPDGGAYVTVEDMARFWDTLMSYELLSKEMTDQLLKPRVAVDEEEQIYYGYSGYMGLDAHHEVVKYIQMGYDPGVNFRAVFVPNTKATIVVCSNESEGAYELLKEIERILM